MTRSESSSLDILIVGAGAVGQVYGAYLCAGGARVSVLVRDRHRDQAGRGFTLHRLRRLAAPHTWSWQPHAVLTDVEELAEMRFDQVWLCVPSDALRDAVWLGRLADLSGQASLVSQHGGPQDAARLHAAAGVERVVHGPIPLLAYCLPLPDDDGLGEGTRYFLPPGPHGFSSADKQRAVEVTRALRRGGLWAHSTRDAAHTYRLGSAVLIPLMAALELSRWSLAGLRGGPWLALALKTSREWVGQLQRQRGAALPWWLGLWQVSLVRGVIWIAPWAVPLPLERFLRAHFTKVGAQTEVMLGDQLQALPAAERAGSATSRLLEALLAARSHRTPAGREATFSTG